MNRAKIICHILMSIDGRISGGFFRLPEAGASKTEYQRLKKSFDANTTLYGRTTAEEIFTRGRNPDLSAFQDARLSRSDFVAGTNMEQYIAVLDPKGGLGWTHSTVPGRDPEAKEAHVVELLTEAVPDAYLAYLQSIGVSYLFCGKDKLSCAQAAEKLYTRFGIQTALLQGGGVANGSFAAEGLIDELSLIIVPALQGGGAPSLAEVPRGIPMPSAFMLCGVRTLSGGGLWLRYSRK